MPDIAAARPVAGQPIETAWGQQVHDAVEGSQTWVGAERIGASVVSSIANQWTAYPLDSEVRPGNGTTWLSATNELQIDVRGMYAIQFSLRFSSVPNTSRCMIGILQGSVVVGGAQVEGNNAQSSAQNVYMMGSAVLACGVGFKLTLSAFSQPANTNVDTGRMTVVRISDLP